MKSEHTTSKGLSGIGSVAVLRNSVKIYDDHGAVHEIAKESIPDYVTLPVQGKRLPCFYRISEMGDQLYGVRPSNGSFVVRFKHIFAKQGEVPKPYTQPGGPRKGKDGRQWVAKDKLVFSAVLAIQDPEWAGCEVPWTQDYLFQPELDGLTKISGSSKSAERLEDFLILCGFNLAEDNIPWSDNVLPDLESLLQALDAVFTIRMENGYIQDAQEIPASLRAAITPPVKKESAAPVAQAPKGNVAKTQDGFTLAEEVEEEVIEES